MTDVEQVLRDRFARDAADAPAADRLATTVRDARRRQRRQRWSVAGVAVAAAAVLFGTAGVATLHPSGPTDPVGAPRSPSARQPSPSTPEAPFATEAVRVLAPLRRPLALPTPARGAACPVGTRRTFPSGGGFTGTFSGVGPGPLYLTGDGTVSFVYPPDASSGYEGTGWGGSKVIWAIDRYDGPLLLRGARIDGDSGLRFDHYLGAVGYVGDAGDGKAWTELAYLGQEGETLRTYPSAVRLRAPGCYAIQVDGTDFTEILVFRAVLEPR